MAEYKFKAVSREKHGKSYASKTRRTGRVPAVVYGPAAKPIPVECDIREIELLYRDTLGKNALLKMELDGKEQTVMFKDVQREPVKSKLLHIDFYHVDAKHPLKLDVPVILDGTASGVKEGGILEHGIRNVHVRCLPDHIPTAIHVDITNLGMEENILVQDLTPPEGVTFLTDGHSVLAHVSEPKEEEKKEEEAAAAGAVAKEGDAKPADAKAGDAKPEEKKEEKK